jgi:hypothetical protein
MGQEPFSPVEIDARLNDVGWNLADICGVRCKYQLDDRIRCPYVFCDWQGNSLAAGQ